MFFYYPFVNVPASPTPVVSISSKIRSFILRCHPELRRFVEGLCSYSEYVPETSNKTPFASAFKSQKFMACNVVPTTVSIVQKEQ